MRSLNHTHIVNVDIISSLLSSNSDISGDTTSQQADADNVKIQNIGADNQPIPN